MYTFTAESMMLSNTGGISVFHMSDGTDMAQFLLTVGKYLIDK